MQKLALAIFMGVGLVSPTHAGMMGMGGHHGGGRGFGGGFGWFGGYHTEATQSYFENTFSELVTEYDDGLAGIEDYYNSDDYTDVVDSLELLSDRYEYFLDGVERTLDRFDSMLTSLTEEISFLDELLAGYQANEELSDERLERVETWITTIQDILGLKFEVITERQSVLTDNYATYTTFADEIDAYLDTIVTAGGGTTDEEATTTGSTAAAIAATMPLLATASAEAVAVCEEASASAVAVPEPHGAVWLVFLSLGVLSRRLRRSV